ncbi:MAG: hypothetical protein R3208_02520 [Ketobacteraceae bacterium]|nr:hypothetical protein [Ketobacteraceae bacterium]
MSSSYSMKRITASYVFFIAASLSLLGTALLDNPQDPLENPLATHHQITLDNGQEQNKQDR